MYSPIDPFNKDHINAIQQFKDSGHPKVLSKTLEVDFDCEFRDDICEKFNLDENFIELANGSQHIVVKDDPKNVEIHIEYYCDESKYDFAVKVNGTFVLDMRGECIFCPIVKSISKIDLSDNN